MRPLPRNDPRQYDDLAGEWWRPGGAFAMLHWLAEARAALVPPAARPGAVLVDLGCGAGLLAPHVAGKGYRHVGVDLVAVGAGAGRRRTACAPCAADVDRAAAGRRLRRRGGRRRDPGARHRPARDGRRGVPGAAPGRAAGARHPQRHRAGPVRRGDAWPSGCPACPRGIHDPALFVDPARARRALCARHGVRLRVRGIRPAVPATAALAGDAGAATAPDRADAGRPPCSTRAGASRQE